LHKIKNRIMFLTNYRYKECYWNYDSIESKYKNLLIFRKKQYISLINIPWRYIMRIRHIISNRFKLEHNIKIVNYWEIKLNQTKIILLINSEFCIIIIKRLMSLKIRNNINNDILKCKFSIKHKEKYSILILNKIKL
jgi:hypothetical protein